MKNTYHSNHKHILMAAGCIGTSLWNTSSYSLMDLGRWFVLKERAGALCSDSDRGDRREAGEWCVLCAGTRALSDWPLASIIDTWLWTSWLFKKAGHTVIIPLLTSALLSLRLTLKTWKHLNWEQERRIGAGIEQAQTVLNEWFAISQVTFGMTSGFHQCALFKCIKTNV